MTKVIGYDRGREFTTLHCHEHSAAGKWIDERSGVANREESFGGRQFMTAEFFQGNCQPGTLHVCISQRLSSAPVLTNHFAHYAFSISATAPHIGRGSDKQQIV